MSICKTKFGEELKRVSLFENNSIFGLKNGIKHELYLTKLLGNGQFPLNIGLYIQLKVK